MQVSNASDLGDDGQMADSATAAGMLGRLTFQLSTDAEGVSLALAGELDLETVPELERELENIDETQLKRLVIDLRDLQFMDSTGLAAIIRAQRSAEANGHALVVRRGSGQVQRLFELTGMSERVTVED